MQIKIGLTLDEAVAIARQSISADFEHKPGDTLEVSILAGEPRPYNKIEAIKHLKQAIQDRPGLIQRCHPSNPTTSGYWISLGDAKKLVEDLAAIILA